MWFFCLFDYGCCVVKYFFVIFFWWLFRINSCCWGKCVGGVCCGCGVCCCLCFFWGCWVCMRVGWSEIFMFLICILILVIGVLKGLRCVMIDFGDGIDDGIWSGWVWWKWCLLIVGLCCCSWYCWWLVGVWGGGWYL